MDVTIYHNPRCGKSRDTLQLLRDRGIEPTVVEYLKTPPDAVRLKHILKLLGISPRDLIRTREPAYEQHGLAGEKKENALIAAMVASPILIERPIVVVKDGKGERAAIGRPPDAVLKIL
jgi:arsenate reductase